MARIFSLLVALVLLLSLPALAQLKSAFTDEQLDTANTKAYPEEKLETCYPFAFVAGYDAPEALKHTLGIRPGYTPQAQWRTAFTTEKKAYFRVAFTTPTQIGTMFMKPMGFWAPDDGKSIIQCAMGQPWEWRPLSADPNVTISYLKEDAAAPGDVRDDSQWITVKPAPQSMHLRMSIFPPGVKTQAVRISVTSPFADGVKWFCGTDYMLFTRGRFYNVVPDAASVYASSQKEKYAMPWSHEFAATADQLTAGGKYWAADAEDDVSATDPQWVTFTWDEPKTLVGLVLTDPFAKQVDVQALKAESTADAFDAPAEEWASATKLSIGIPYRAPNLVAQGFSRPMKTKAIRLQITDTFSNENEDVPGITQGGKRVVILNGVMLLTDLGSKPAPYEAAAKPATSATPAPPAVSAPK